MKKPPIYWAIAAVLVFTVLMSGCATRSLYSDVGGQFSKGYEAAGKIVNESFETAVRDTRRLAVAHYITSGDNPDNLVSSDVDPSFRRYVCAGVGLYANQQKALTVLGAYNKMIADLSAEPSDEIGALWASIWSLRQPKKPLQFESAESGAFDTCIKGLKDPLVPPKGELIVPIVPEALPAIFAAPESLAKLAEAAKAVATLSLKQIDEAARGKAIKEYVTASNDTVTDLIGKNLEDGSHTEGELTEGVMGRALDLRRRSALVVPYYKFTHLLSLDRKSKAHEMVDLGDQIHLALSEFDALRMRPDPRNVVAAMRASQAELIRLANGDLTTKEAWAIFKAYADTLGELEKALGDVIEAGNAI